MKSVEVVEIDKLIPIFKEGQPANAIEVARIKDLNDNECEFNIIVGKGLYNIGDSVVYIQPDYCIPKTAIFNEYWFPSGDASKCKLGKSGRVRAIKFNFKFEGENDSIYSNGILLPVNEVKECISGECFDKILAISDLEYLTVAEVLSNLDLQEALGITKYVAEDSHESTNQGLTAGERPSFLYETDEERIELHKKEVQYCFENKEIVSGTIKRDGSSITLFCKKDDNENLGWRIGVCSRKQEKKLDQSHTRAYKYLVVNKSDTMIDVTGYELHPYFQKETNVRGWYCDQTQEFFTEKEVTNIWNGDKFQPIVIEVRDNWVDTVKKYGYLDKLLNYCIENNTELALRGELIGAGNKGNGNKLNLDAKLDQQVIWFGVDDLKSGFSRRIHYGGEHNLTKLSFDLDLNVVEEVFQGVYDYDSLIKTCHEIFDKIKYSTGQIIEGIVIRSKYSNNLSVKYINPEYDSKS